MSICKKMNLCLRRHCYLAIVNGIRRVSTSTSEVLPQNEEVITEEDTHDKEAEIEKRRNKSGLSPAHFNLVNGRKPYEIPMALAHKTVKYNRKMYGKYGSASGVNPSLCWPSKRDIDDMREYDSVAYPYTIQHMMEQVTLRREEQKRQTRQRDEEVALRMAKSEQWKRELNNRIEKKIADAQAAKDKKDRLVEEVRRHFGFKLDPRDERFQEMVAKREKEQKKLEKQARREAREKQLIANLQQKNAELAKKDTTE